MSLKKFLSDYLTKPVLILFCAVILFLAYYYLAKIPSLRGAFLISLIGNQPQEYQKHIRYLMWFSGSFLFLFTVPLITTSVIGGRKAIVEMGFSVKESAKWLKITAIITLSIMAIYTVSFFAFPEIKAKYPLSKYALKSVKAFVIYELFYALYFTGWEYFFHGLLVFGFKDSLGRNAVLMGVFPYVLMHLGKPIPEVLTSAAGGFALAVLSYESGSFWWGYIVHSASAVYIDTLSFLSG